MPSLTTAVLESCYQQLQTHILAVASRLDRVEAELSMRRDPVEDEGPQNSAAVTLIFNGEHVERMEKFEERLKEFEKTLSGESHNPTFVKEHSHKSSGMFNPYLKYSLGNSVWDTSVVLGLPEVGPMGSFFMGFVFLLNVFIQIFMVYVLLTDESFNNPYQFSDMLEEMFTWRRTDGHDVTLEGMDGVNLANRVCNLDEGLSLASLQVGSLKEIRSYLDLKDEEFEMPTFSPGPFLCMLCIMVLTFVVIHEFRQNICFLLCISTLPNSKTKIRHGRIMAISRFRYIVVFILTLVRLAISAGLLYSGVMWLSSTSSLENLILNAAALGFVLEIDESLFESIVPYQVAALIDYLQPLEFDKRLYKMDAILPVLFTCATSVIAYHQYILPNSDSMMEINRVMCGPSSASLNFVMGYAPQTDMVLSRYSTPFSGGAMNDATAVRRREAVDEILSNPSLVEAGVSQQGKWQTLGNRLQQGGMVPIESFWIDQAEFSKALVRTKVPFWNSRNPECDDIDTWSFVDKMELLYFFEKVRRETGVREELSLSSIMTPDFFACSDYAHLCDEKQDLDFRMICPETCGCPDPYSGLAYSWKGSNFGCLTTCQNKFSENVQFAECRDADAAPIFPMLYSKNATFRLLLEDLISEGRVHDALEMIEVHILGVINDSLGRRFKAAAVAVRAIGETVQGIEEGALPAEGYPNPDVLRGYWIVLSWARYWISLNRYADKRFLTRPIINSTSDLMTIFSCSDVVRRSESGNMKLWSRLDSETFIQHPWHPCNEESDVGGIGSVTILCARSCFILATLRENSRLQELIPSCKFDKMSMQEEVEDMRRRETEEKVKEEGDDTGQQVDDKEQTGGDKGQKGDDKDQKEDYKGQQNGKKR